MEEGVPSMRRRVTRRLRQLGRAMGTETLMKGSKVTLTWWGLGVGLGLGFGFGFGFGLGLGLGLVLELGLVLGLRSG